MKSAQIEFFGGPDDYCVRSNPDEIGENPELLCLLHDYYEKLGITAFEEDKGQVKWLLKDQWYSDEEIKRIFELKSFI